MNMFEDFLREYIKDLIDCGDEEYEITDEQINNIASIVENDDYVWQIMDDAIYQELDKYSKGAEENE